MDGGRSINISNNKYNDWAYSAYNDKLYVISDRDTCNHCYFLYETDAKGSYWRKISKTIVQDSWVSLRADGTELIIKPEGSNSEVFQIIDLNGNTLSIVDPKMDYINDPCFSPDGKSIVFRGYNGDIDRTNEAELYRYNLKTLEKVKITKSPPNTMTFGKHQYHASPPRWNSEYGKITYSSSVNQLSTIKSLDLQERTSQSITQRNVKAIWHDISADGKYLVYDAQLDFKADSTTTQIFVMDFEKRNARRLTIGPGYKQGPVFVYEK